MNLALLGEFGLIEAIRRRARMSHSAWRVSIGDDAAVLTPPRGQELVLTTDAVVEGVHFRWRTTDPRSLGHKALAVNLSDVGAMGARPLGFLLTLALPRGVADAQLDGFFAGLFALARASHCPLVGGDITRARDFAATITAIGAVPRGRALLRSGARPGDRLFVTGSLGGAAAGLALLERGRVTRASERALVRRQIAPRPPFGVGGRLVRLGLAHAAIDVSDGLAQDLGHVLDESGVGARLELERLPLAPGLTRAAARLGLDPLSLALSGGEDYELLFAAPPRAPSAAVLSRRLQCRVTEIGAVTRQHRLVLLRAGRRVEWKPSGFQHFKGHSRGSEK